MYKIFEAAPLVIILLKEDREKNDINKNVPDYFL
jgi:hypothetical protein